MFSINRATLKTTTCRTLKSEIVSSIGLAVFVGPTARNKTKFTILVQANWTNEVDRLPFSKLFFQFENQITNRSFKKLVAFLLFMKFVNSAKLFSQRNDCVAQFYIHQIYCSQLRSEIIEQSTCLILVDFVATSKQRLEFVCSRSRLVGNAKCSTGKTHDAFNTSQVHFGRPSNTHSRTWQPTDCINVDQLLAGVGSDFPEALGTGAGTAAQDTSNLRFLKKAS